MLLISKFSITKRKGLKEKFPINKDLHLGRESFFQSDIFGAIFKAIFQKSKNIKKRQIRRGFRKKTFQTELRTFWPLNRRFTVNLRGWNFTCPTNFFKNALWKLRALSYVLYIREKKIYTCVTKFVGPKMLTPLSTPLQIRRFGGFWQLCRKKASLRDVLIFWSHHILSWISWGWGGTACKVWAFFINWLKS